MARVVRAKVKVAVNSEGSPQSFIWQNRRYHIHTIIDAWKEIGEWWDNATPRTVYRALTASQGVYELHLLHNTGTWVLYRIDD